MLLSSHRMFVFFFFFYVFFPLPLFLVSDRPLQYYYAYAELAIIPGTFILYLYFFTVENIQQKRRQPPRAQAHARSQEAQGRREQEASVDRGFGGKRSAT